MLSNDLYTQVNGLSYYVPHCVTKKKVSMFHKKKKFKKVSDTMRRFTLGRDYKSKCEFSDSKIVEGEAKPHNPFSLILIEC